ILKPGEIVTGVDIPDPEDGSRSGYLKFKERGAWDFAVVSVAAVLKKRGNQIVNGRIAFGGIAPIPWEDKNLNTKIKGELNTQKIQGLSLEILKEAEPLEQNAYKITLARNLTKRLLNKLI
ncbi:MAG: xanthine dehydrogenase family protein subunit M, partial [Calditrichaceae bacterium]